MKKQSLIVQTLIALAVLLFSGCATVTRGTKDTLVIESDPAGATVQLSTGQTAKTPASFQLPRKDSVVVTITREGYEPVTVNVQSQIVGAGAAGMAGNVLVGGVIGVGVDAWTGATKSLKPNPVSVKLVKIEPKAQTVAAPVAEPEVKKESTVSEAAPVAATPAAAEKTVEKPAGEGSK